jgi:MFS family permease
MHGRARLGHADSRGSREPMPAEPAPSSSSPITPATDGSPGIDLPAVPADFSPGASAATALEASIVCGACGYDLTGSSTALCPECGTDQRLLSSSPSTWAPLRRLHYRNVWLGQFGSSIGGWMESVGVAWIITTTTENPAVMLGYLAIAQLGPMMVLGIHGGIVADRVDRKKLLLVTQALMMLIAAALAAVSFFSAAAPHAGVLVLLVFLNGVAMAYNAPAWQVLTPRLVPREELTRAIYLNGMQFNLARAVGPAIAGALYYFYGPTVLFVVNMVSFIGVLLAVASTPKTPKPPAPTASAWQQLSEAFDFVIHQRGPRAAFLAIVVFGLLAAPLMRLMPMFVTHVFTLTKQPELAAAGATLLDHQSERTWAYGLMLAAMGVGAVLGVFIKRIVPPWYPAHHFIPLSILGGGLSIALFAATANYYIALVALLLCGVFWLWSFNSAFAAIQMLVPDAMRGRVMALVNVACFGSMAIGPMLTGSLGNGIHTKNIHIDPGEGIQIGVGVTGVALVLAALVMLIWRTPEVDGLKPGDVGYDRRPGLLRGILATAHRPQR